MKRNYVCIKAFPNTSIDIGDKLQIEKLNNDKYVIDGAIQTDRQTVYEHFKIVKLPGFKFAPYSHSKVECWVGCPKKFEWNYIIKPPKTESPSPILEKGTLFHAVLEFDINDKLDEFDIPDEFKALSIDDCEKIIGQALDFAETSENYKRIKSLEGIKVPEQEMFLGPDLTPVETLDESLIRGFIDLLIYDEKNNKCFIYDWKTGGKSVEALKKWPKPKDQLELYAIWAYEVFGCTEIETSFVYVEHDFLATYTFSEKDIPILKKKVINKIEQIEKDEKFSKAITQLCAWCDFKENCLGISNLKNPREITLDEIKTAAGQKQRSDRPKNSKNSAFLNKILSKNKKS